MTFVEVVNKFIDSSVHIYLEHGAYVDKDYDLEFDKTEHDKHFCHGYYVPDYRKWLLMNASLKIK